MDPQIIYHVTTREALEKAQSLGYYEAESLALEGFIHCSTKRQVKGVLERYFTGKTNLVKLFIDIRKLTNTLKYELAPSVGEEFPHIYGVINLDAIVEIELLN